MFSNRHLNSAIHLGSPKPFAGEGSSFPGEAEVTQLAAAVPWSPPPASSLSSPSDRWSSLVVGKSGQTPRGGQGGSA